MAEIHLPAETLSQLKDSAAKLVEVDKHISKMKIAGIPTETMEKEVNDQRNKLNKLRDGFFPGEVL